MFSPGCNAISIKWHQFDTNTYELKHAPAQIQALFNNECLLVYGFISRCTQATLNALVDNQELQAMVSTTELQKTTGTMLHKLAARAFIRDHEQGMFDENETEHEAKKQLLKSWIIQLSQENSIVTQFTSFVAIEKRDVKDDQRADTMDVLELVAKEDVDILPYMQYLPTTQGTPSQSDVTSDSTESSLSEESLELELGSLASKFLRKHAEPLQKSEMPLDYMGVLNLKKCYKPPGKSLILGAPHQVPVCSAAVLPPPPPLPGCAEVLPAGPEGQLTPPTRSPHQKKEAPVRGSGFSSLDFSGAIRESSALLRQKAPDELWNRPPPPPQFSRAFDAGAGAAGPSPLFGSPVSETLSLKTRKKRATFMDVALTEDEQMDASLAGNFELQYQGLSLKKHKKLKNQRDISWPQVFKQQNQDGFWQLTPELGTHLGLDVDYLVNVQLTKNGIQSLGLKGKEKLLQLIATLLVLQLVWFTKLEDIIFKSLMKLNDSPPSWVLDPVQKAIEWARRIDREFPAICQRLELGKDWDSFTKKLLHIE